MTRANLNLSFPDELTERDRKRVASYIEHNAGIQLPASKHSLIETRLRKRQRKLGYYSLKEYIDFALSSSEGQSERINLLDALTTNKTDFYREPDHFKFLHDYILGEFFPGRAAENRPLRIWSAGCSSGEEPYTLAMEMLEIQRHRPGFKFEILATDISVSCLQTARQAIYPHCKIEPVPMALRKRYLMRGKSNGKELVRMAPEVREKITFTSFNLLTDSYDFKPRFDVIFCRNVMIYFNNEDRSQIAHRFAHSLQTDGLLLIGHSETLADRGTVFKQIIPTVYRVAGREISNEKS